MISDLQARLEQAIALAATDHRDAAAFLRSIATAARIADDLVDEPQNVGRRDIETFVRTWTCDLPSNPFFLRHYSQLSAVLAVASNAWFDANDLEQTGDACDYNYSRVLRDYVNELCPLVALLVRGPAYMRQVSPRIRALFAKDEFVNPNR